MVLWITAGKDLSKDSKKPDLKKERTWKSKKRMQLLIRGTAKQISDGFVSDDVDLICGIAT